MVRPRTRTVWLAALAAFAASPGLRAEDPASVDLAGKVVVEKGGAGERAFLEADGERFEAADPQAAKELAKLAGAEAEVRCVLGGGEAANTILRVIEAVKADPAAGRLARFRLPCEKYRSGLKAGGNFGILVGKGAAAPFAGTYHLAEDVWLPGGTEVRCVADGTVVYSDFSPTWTDARGVKHWNLGNVIAVEHPLSPKEGNLEFVCSVYVHLGKDRRAKPGDRVRKGSLLGFIGADKSEENGQYPAHLHFGLHEGPWLQVSPARRRQLILQAAAGTLPVIEGGRVVGAKGKVADIKLVRGTDVEVTFEDSPKVASLSILVGSTSPGYQPAPIVNWCSGYGDKAEVEDWLKPSAWIQARLGALDR
ncbi:MAG: M23 family metallopeptidase [Planctomycetes bacterium]|nr:M23 family metallopeptidase [Planctomycetota bacterium]